MDLPLIVGVMRRYKKFVAFGVVVALALAAGSYATASKTWESQAEVLITQGNDPYGAVPRAGSAGNGGFLASLASVYAQVANGTAIQQSIYRTAGPGAGTIQAAEVIDSATGNPLPLVTFTSESTTAGGAVKLTTQAVAALANYVTTQQSQAGVGADQRVTFETIRSGAPPVITGGASKTVPMLIFAGVLAAFIVMAFMRENMNPKTAAALGRVPSQDLAMRAVDEHGGQRPVRTLVPAEGNTNRFQSSPPRRLAADRATESPAQGSVSERLLGWRQ